MSGGGGRPETATRRRQYDDAWRLEPPSLLKIQLRSTLSRYGPSLLGDVANKAIADASSSTTAATALSGVGGGSPGTPVASYAQHMPPQVVESLSLDLLVTKQELVAELALPEVIAAIEKIRREANEAAVSEPVDPYFTFQMKENSNGGASSNNNGNLTVQSWSPQQQSPTSLLLELWVAVIAVAGTGVRCS